MSAEELLPDICTGWRLAARVLAEERSWSYFRAYDHVIVNYLEKGGDTRPLLDLILNLRRVPGKRATEYIGAMMEPRLKAKFPDGELPYNIGFNLNRKRGRPLKEAETPEITEVCTILVCGLNAIELNMPPERRFWIYLASALDHDGYKRSNGSNFPLKAKTQRAAGSKGSRGNPEITLRTVVLHSAVSDAIGSGAKYDSAISDVVSEIERLGRAEQWKGWIGDPTVRHAYKAIKKRII